MAPDIPSPIEHLLALKAAAPFSTLPPEDLALLVARATVRRFDAGEDLVVADEPVRVVHLMLEGAATELRGGHRWAVREPYEIVGGVDALGDVGDDLRVIADVPTRTLEVEREALLDVCFDRFEVLATMTAGIAALALAARRRLGPTAGYPAPGRTAGSPRTTPLLDLGPRMRFLRSVPALADVAVRPLALVAAAAEEVQASAGRELWSAGDAADHLLLVVAGTVACRTPDDSQRFTLGARDAAGVLDALADAPRWYDARADEPVSALRIATRDLLDVLEDHPEAAMAAMEHLACVTSRLVGAAARLHASSS